MRVWGPTTVLHIAYVLCARNRPGEDGQTGWPAPAAFQSGPALVQLLFSVNMVVS